MTWLVKFVCPSTAAIISAATFLLLVALRLDGAMGVEPATPPFVIGFERFGRHGDIANVQAGRLLVSELNCTACHSSDLAWFAPKTGPRLESVGLVLQPEWIERFLAAPQHSKPGTTMPDVLGRLEPTERDAVTESLVAYLTSLKTPLSEVKASGAVPVPHEFWNRGDAVAGRELYHQVGCVACHTPDPEYATRVESDSAIDKLIDSLDADELEELGLGAAARRVESIPHNDLPGKYTAQGLTMFLLDPAGFRSGGRMPSLKLLPTEAAHIAAYLLEIPASQSHASIRPDDKLVALGRQWFATLKCNQCHATGDKFATQDFLALDQLDPARDQGCLASSPDSTVGFNLDETQVAAIREALHASSTKMDDIDRMQHVLLQMNCYACHERDGLGGLGRERKAFFETVASVDLGDEGRLPPSLTGVGGKLKSAWFKKVLLGDKADIRPHMRIRMPKFHSQVAEAIPKHAALIDDPPTDRLAESKSERPDLVDAGRELMDVGCVQCHAFRGFALPGVVGVDLAGVTNRVHEDWFREFILNPGELKSRTRMPTFFPDGKSQLPTLLGGDSGEQITAIWSYLRNLERQPLPQKIVEARSQNYELKPTERPIILRTFMPDVGTHAIAVGFPSGTHIAFDAQRMLLAAAWHGRFIDAQGTWFIRSAPPAPPLAEKVRAIQTAPLFLADGDDSPVVASNVDDYRFGGYVLSDRGVPTFLYSFKEIQIEDTVTPLGLELRRRLLVRSPTNTKLWLVASEGVTVDPFSSMASRSDDGMTVTVTAEDCGPGHVIDGAGKRLWVLPFAARQSTSIEVQYKW